MDMAYQLFPKKVCSVVCSKGFFSSVITEIVDRSFVRHQIAITVIDLVT